MATSQTEAGESDAETTDALPFTLEEPHPNTGVGVCKSIVALANHVGECDSSRDARGSIDDDGRCYYCGYDRGTLTSHTEVPGMRLECRQCERTLLTREE